MSFTDKVVLITGASSGIGAATAVFFARNGARLSLVGRNIDNLQKTRENCLNELPVGSAEPFLIQADVTQDAEKIINETIQTFGQIDVLVNNAGVGAYSTIETTTLEEYDHIMNTNMRSVYHLTMLAVQHLAKTQGNIVNVSSLCGIRTFGNATAYHVSKAALDQFTNCISLELAAKKIRVNSVNPGMVVGEFQQNAGMSAENYEKFLKNCGASYPLGRPAYPEDVAKAIVFLASDVQAGYITGIHLSVDGGKLNQCPR